MDPSSLSDTPLISDFIVPTNKDVQAKLRPDGGKRPRPCVRREFSGSYAAIPDSKITYLCGNSLGLPSKRSTTLVQEELKVWGTQ
jgi:kynureninase